MTDDSADRDRLTEIFERLLEKPEIAAVMSRLVLPTGLSPLFGSPKLPRSAEWENSNSVREAWIVKTIQRSVDERRSAEMSASDAELLEFYQHEIGQLCALIDNQGRSSRDILPTEVRGFFLGALEVGFVLGALMEDAAGIRRAMQIERGKAGGKNSGKGRRSKALSDARIIGSEAVRLRKQHPGWSQDRLASDIIAAWKTEGHPGHSTVKKVISDLEKDGRLPRRRLPNSVNEAASSS